MTGYKNFLAFIMIIAVLLGVYKLFQIHQIDQTGLLSIENGVVKTAVPTDLGELNVILGSLETANCSLPCYIGITPGVTETKEALAIINKLGILLEDKLSYTSSVGTLDLYYFRERFETELFRLFIASKDELVIYIRIDNIITKPKEQFEESQIVELFKAQGYPDRIGIPQSEEREGIFLLYESKGILFEAVGGGIKNDFICFDNLLTLSIYLYSEEYSEEYTMFNLKVSPQESYWQPIEVALGLTIQEFANLILADRETCFIVKSSN
ncbi:MAG: hypothetical protein KIT46_08255 [Anaerolineales bacterium]|nr:hypothetical protein [Anaerolineales bacterium]MCW5856022.1 hypothetical protein [Anaerolineales bacterium]